MKPVIIFDMDGTLADVTHRRVHMQGAKKDWKAWNAGMANDAPNWPVINTFNAIANTGQYDIYIFSGRSESDDVADYRAITIQWLNSVGIYSTDYVDLWMRAAKDNRSDVIVKREMLNKLRAMGADIHFTVDDRQSVVDMWRSEGITCFQVAPGDFDKTNSPAVAPVNPGRLVMLIGPSGAGKSSYLAHAGIDRSYIVSSDAIRQELCDDFRDQSKNSQIFAALHAIVKTRIEHGLPTYVDATNIRDRDRKAIRDLVPENTKIVYMVINRPLDIKKFDGGWRNDVMFGSQTLIEKHEAVFQSNKKAILSGDGDPRVTVSTSFDAGV